jgi:hypothetical protein
MTAPEEGPTVLELLLEIEAGTNALSEELRAGFAQAKLERAELRAKAARVWAQLAAMDAHVDRLSRRRLSESPG